MAREDLNKTKARVTVGGSLFTPFVQTPNNLVVRYRDSRCEVKCRPVFIGRDHTCDIVIDSSDVSRCHAAIYPWGKAHIVRDLHSTNGLSVNGRMVKQAEVRAGDVIEISEQQLHIDETSVRSGLYENRVAVLFMDVAGFTTLSERHGRPFITELQGVLESLDDEVLRRLGCPVKCLGDGLMAAFGVWPQSDRRYSPIDEALVFANQATATYAQQMAAYLPGAGEVPLRFGLALGEVEYQLDDGLDLFGDTVNLASRLESVNKVYGTRVCMDERAYAALRDKAHVREIDTVRVKGRRAPVTLFVYDDRAKSFEDNDTGVVECDAKEKPTEFRALYQRGLELYRKGRFDEALEQLSEAVGVYGDRPALALRRRILAWKESELGLPGEGWDGVWSLDSK